MENGLIILRIRKRKTDILNFLDTLSEKAHRENMKSRVGEDIE